jgi:uncharacterized protein YdcH (DUF465 family)
MRKNSFAWILGISAGVVCILPIAAHAQPGAGISPAERIINTHEQLQNTQRTVPTSKKPAQSAPVVKKKPQQQQLKDKLRQNRKTSNGSFSPSVSTR